MDCDPLEGTEDLDNDGLPNFQDADDDGDGVSSLDEDACPNNGDSNADTLLDRIQNTVACFGDPVTTIELDDPSCTQIVNVYSTDYATMAAQVVAGDGTSTSKNEEYNFPYGINGFRVACDQATITFIYHGVADLAGHRYVKYGPQVAMDMNSFAWFDYPVVFGQMDIGGVPTATATITIVDNGIADADPTPGFIVDPGGPIE
ncbi:MAG: hypothetical protein H6765_10480 [Candidatus Peribacteria bacterium]|nr:MAG: hypothetical protein H6765_10480 [Candidatus Peribacteria bacterium]